MPQLAPTRAEERRGASPGDREALSTWEEGGSDPDDLRDEEDRAGTERHSAPDLSAADLRRAGEGHPLPSLDRTAASPAAEPDRDPAAPDDRAIREEVPDE